MDTTAVTSRIDRIGAGASLLCAIHCALTPVAVALLPFISRGFPGSEGFEALLIGVSIALSGWNVWRGIRLHGDRRVLPVYGAAVVLILFGRLIPEGFLHLAFMVTGGVLFVCSYAVNHHLTTGCNCHHH